MGEKIQAKWLVYKTKQKNVIFNNIKQDDLLVIVFIMLKLVQMKLIQIKAVYQIV